VRQRQPSLSPSQAIAQARREFHQAASAILVTALRAARTARPKCHWGYYGEMSACSLRSPCTEPGPDGTDPLCGYDHPTEGAALRAIAEQHRPVWDESDRLFPSIYFQGIQPSGSINSYACMDAHFRGARCRNYTLAQNRAMIHSTIAQAMRSAAPAASTNVQGTAPVKGKPVLPYMWQYCDSLFPCFQNSTFSLTRWGLEASMRLPYDLGAAGLVIWVDAEEANRLPELHRLVASETGPLARELLDSVATCATQQCSGHGRCQTLPALPPPPPLPPAPPAPPPPGCLKSCALTPCGKCATGCPSDSKGCRMPDGRAASKNECVCNEDKILCKGNLTLCPPPPPTLTVTLKTKCVCDPGYSGAGCEAVQPSPVKTDDWLSPVWSGLQPCDDSCAAEKPRQGFSLLPNMTHTAIYLGAHSYGTYNHGPIPYWWGGSYFVAWHNAPMYAGHHMRVLLSTSADAVTWSRPTQLFPNVSAAAAQQEGSVLEEPFWEQQGRLYAFAHLDVDDIPDSPAQHGSPINFLISRRVFSPQRFGPIFWATDHPPPTSWFGFPLYTAPDAQTQADMKRFLSSLLSEYVPLEPSSEETNERAIYVYPRSGQGVTLVQLVCKNHDTAACRIPRTCSAAVCNSHVPALRQAEPSCFLASTCTLPATHSSAAAPPTQRIDSPATGSWHFASLDVVLHGVLQSSRAPNHRPSMLNCSWSPAVPSNIPDAPSNYCTSTLPDGRIYLLSNPLTYLNISYDQCSPPTFGQVAIRW
jgi:hypothetical protein